MWLAKWWGLLIRLVRLLDIAPVGSAVSAYTFAADTSVKAMGELFGQADAITAVNGHGLGRQLATGLSDYAQSVHTNFYAGSAANVAGWRAAA